MEDLINARADAEQRKKTNFSDDSIIIRIGLSSCGMAAGAGETLDSLEHLIASESLPGIDKSQIHLSQIGCIGLCALEPIVQVQMPGQPLITYGKVTPEVARRILSEHIGNGLIIHQNEIETI
jgi:(2Fe-2S) ferredoxin